MFFYEQITFLLLNGLDLTPNPHLFPSLQLKHSSSPTTLHYKLENCNIGALHSYMFKPETDCEEENNTETVDRIDS